MAASSAPSKPTIRLGSAARRRSGSTASRIWGPSLAAQPQAGEREVRRGKAGGRQSRPSPLLESERSSTMPPAIIRKVRKAVFPAAGLGTRFLPATKAQPKEMLPLVDKPIIQYGVEEALDSGIDNIIIVTGRGKNSIEDHFDVSFELERMLEDKGKTDLLAVVREVSDMIHVAYVRQKEALGLGHAVLTSQPLVGDEPFAVLLADDVIDAPVPVIRQMLDVYEATGASVVAVEQIAGEAISSYGVVGIAAPTAEERRRNQHAFHGPAFRITDLVEKPRAADAPSDL